MNSFWTQERLSRMKQREMDKLPALYAALSRGLKARYLTESHPDNPANVFPQIATALRYVTLCEKFMVKYHESV